MIKHLVISGGGIWGLTCYGALKETEKSGLWNIENIESIYSTSVGSIVSVILALNYDWQTIDDFLIKRPWHQVFKFDIYSLLSAVEKRGIFDKTVIVELFEPLFKGKDISLEITLKEFYELTHIDFHCFSTEINGQINGHSQKMTKVDFSHQSFPDWKLLDAVYCSCCLPILFSPFLYDVSDSQFQCYIDGGILNNYPLVDCIQNVENTDEIFGIAKKTVDQPTTVGKTSSIFDFLLFFFGKVVREIENPYPEIVNQLNMNSSSTNLYDIYFTASSLEERMKLIRLGEEAGKNYIDSLLSQTVDKLV